MPDSNFPFPLDTDVQVEVPVKKVKFDPQTNQLSHTWSTETQTVRYMDVPKEKVRCKKGEHIFKVVDGSKGLFSCNHCTFSRKVYPSTYKFIQGKLIHKVTGEVI